MKRKDILAVYKAGPEAVIKLINSLIAIIAELKCQVTPSLTRLGDTNLYELSLQKGSPRACLCATQENSCYLINLRSA